MPLKNILQEAPHELEARHIQQIIAWAGDGHLRDGSSAAVEFREYLEQIPASRLAEYCTQCLDESFSDSGLVLQDLVNEVGRRLGFDVQFGRYRGSQSAIGFDGIWKFPSGHQAIVEVKTTSAYQLRLETIANYRRRLIEQQQLIEADSSALIVVGRDDTSDLEAQIRGSRHAWDIRLISVEALLRLLDVKEELEDPTIVKKIHEILIPREFTKLDQIIELLFSTASDLRPEVVDAAITREPEQPGSASDDETVARFQQVSVDRLEKNLGVKLVRQTRSSMASPDGQTIVVCKASREYGTGEAKGYWFGFYEFQMEMITTAQRGYAAFQCGTSEKLVLVPATDLQSWSSSMNQTRTKTNAYWHVHITDLTLVRKAGAPPIDLTRYLLPAV